MLGKVTEEVVSDLPVLARNKLLDKLNPKLVDQLADLLNKELSEKASEATGEKGQDTSSQVAPFTGGVSSRIAGPSFKVIPLAIFA